MTTCLSIPQCSKCEYPNKENCFSCSKNHILDTTTNTCKCQNNPPCAQFETCVQETSTCLPSNLCMKSPFCTSCSEIDPTWCSSCLPGYLPDNFGNCQLLPCNVENCAQCDPKNEKCSCCVKGLFLSSNNTCECELDSNKPCPQNQTCNMNKTCQDASICLKDSTCAECDALNPETCSICADGYYSEWGFCAKSFCKDKFCDDCEGDESVCNSCQKNYQKSPLNGVCECVLGSGEGCMEGSSCSRERRVCVGNGKCKIDVENCGSCWAQDQELCGACELGFTLSNDRKNCVKSDSCMVIKGCKRCNNVVPSMCGECDIEITGLGEGCLQAVGGMSIGGIIGIVVGVLVVLGGIVVGVVLIKKAKDQKNLQAVLERPTKDFL